LISSFGSVPLLLPQNNFPFLFPHLSYDICSI
jgi:hypothetical protein